MKKRDIIIIIGGIAFLTLVVFLSLLLGDKFQVQSCSCPKVVSQNFIFLFIILATIFIGSLLYYLFSLKIDEKESTISKNIEVINSILNSDEKEVLVLIAKNKGEIEQSKVSKKYDRIKAHRILKKLQEKNIIDIKKEGKTNKVILKKELREELVK